MKTIRKLNTLRGLAVMTVLMEHYSNVTMLWSRKLGDGAGQIGVMLFFILSGFLMSCLYIEKRFNLKEVKAFIIARFARVIPLFFFVVTASYILNHMETGAHFTYDIKDLKTLAAHLLTLSGTSVMWTIPCEIRFYLFFIGLWYWYTRKPAAMNIFMAVVFIFLLLSQFPIKREIFIYGLLMQWLIPGCVHFFFMGVVFGQLYARGVSLLNYQSHCFLSVLILIPLAYPHIASEIFNIPFNPDASLLWKDVGLFLVVSALFFTIVFLVPDDNAILSNRFGDFLGKISYSLYLLHVPVLLAMAPAAKTNALIFLPLFFTASILVSWISYTLLENPARQRIRSLTIQPLHASDQAQRVFK